MSILKTTLKYFRDEVLFPVGIIEHLNELQEGDGIMQNFNKGKTNSTKIAH